MDIEFRNLYNQELALLKEQAAEFAKEYPGVADRLGGLLEDSMDPMVLGLLQGSAFLAARVQLKLKHEFADFTVNLIDQIAPHYLAPTPSFVLVRAKPKFGDPALREGRTYPGGAAFDATYREIKTDGNRDPRGKPDAEPQRSVACRFTLAAPITLWPLEIVKAEYLTGAGPLQALLPNMGVNAMAGLRLQLTLRATAQPEGKPEEKEPEAKPEAWVSSLRLESLRFHLLGAEDDAVALYEQIFAHCRGLYFRYLDRFSGAKPVAGDPRTLRQIGFDAEEALLPNDKDVFRGFDFLRDYFAFPRRFLGFDLGGLGAIVPLMKSKTIDVIMAFDDVNPRLAAAVNKGMFALYTAPGVNLFTKRLDRIPVKTNQHEYHVVPDRSRTLDFEANRVESVWAHVPGVAQKVPVEPLYSAAAARGGAELCYTIRRLPRPRTHEEKKYGVKSDYVGTDVFIALGERSDRSELLNVAELSVDALCTNRHLAELIPVGESGADFRFLNDTEQELACVAGPTRPLEPVMTAKTGRGLDASTGEVAWRLINMLSLNHLGLLDRGAQEGAQALRETLVLFANLADKATDRKIRGVRSLDARPIVRRLRHPEGAATARGLEVTVTLEERAFEGSGAFLLGAVLDRFFAEYVAMNHFTQTLIATPERGEIMRWPPRIGLRGVA